MSLKKRHTLRKKEANAVLERLCSGFGMDLQEKNISLEVAKNLDFLVYLFNNSVFAFEKDGKTFPAVKAILEHGIKNKFVTVDMGAVPYVMNGADIMAPGIVEADPEIMEGDGVWLRDIRNGKALAVGIALVNGETMVEGKKGKAVRNLHYIGDELWNLAP